MMIESRHKSTKNPSKATPIKNVSLRVGSLLRSPPLLEIKFSRAPTLMTFDARLIGAGNEKKKEEERRNKERRGGSTGNRPGPEKSLRLNQSARYGPARPIE